MPAPLDLSATRPLHSANKANEDEIDWPPGNGTYCPRNSLTAPVFQDRPSLRTPNSVFGAARLTSIPSGTMSALGFGGSPSTELKQLINLSDGSLWPEDVLQCLSSINRITIEVAGSETLQPRSDNELESGAFANTEWMRDVLYKSEPRPQAPADFTDELELFFDSNSHSAQSDNLEEEIEPFEGEDEAVMSRTSNIAAELGFIDTIASIQDQQDAFAQAGPVAQFDTAESAVTVFASLNRAAAAGEVEDEHEDQSRLFFG
jgi:hypothetical protein